MAYTHILNIEYNNHKVEAEINFNDKEIKFKDETETSISVMNKICVFYKQCVENLHDDCDDLKKIELNKK